MPHSFADITSEDPARLLRRLCNHWQHKFEIERRDEQHALIPMGEFGTTELTIMTPGILHVQAQHTDSEQLPRLKQVIENHLQRFTRDETLLFDWHDEA